MKKVRATLVPFVARRPRFLDQLNMPHPQSGRNEISIKNEISISWRLFCTNTKKWICHFFMGSRGRFERGFNGSRRGVICYSRSVGHCSLYLGCCSLYVCYYRRRVGYCSICVDCYSTHVGCYNRSVGCYGHRIGSCTLYVECYSRRV